MDLDVIDATQSPERLITQHVLRGCGITKVMQECGHGFTTEDATAFPVGSKAKCALCCIPAMQEVKRRHIEAVAVKG